jgi:hypothetical protein
MHARRSVGPRPLVASIQAVRRMPAGAICRGVPVASDRWIRPAVCGGVPGPAAAAPQVRVKPRLRGVFHRYAFFVSLGSGALRASVATPHLRPRHCRRRVADGSGRWVRPLALCRPSPCRGRRSRRRRDGLGFVAYHRPGPGCLGEAGVQPRPDLLRGVRAATSLCSGDHHPGGGDAHEACQTDYLPPAHLPTIRPCPTCTSASTRPLT